MIGRGKGAVNRVVNLPRRLPAIGHLDKLTEVGGDWFTGLQDSLFDFREEGGAEKGEICLGQLDLISNLTLQDGF